MSEKVIDLIISGMIELIIGFVSGYKYCFKTKVTKKQMQKAGDNSTLIQVGDIDVKHQ